MGIIIKIFYFINQNIFVSSILCFRFSLNYVPNYCLKQVSKIFIPESIGVKIRLIYEIISKHLGEFIKPLLLNASPYIEKHLI